MWRFTVLGPEFCNRPVLRAPPPRLHVGIPLLHTLWLDVLLWGVVQEGGGGASGGREIRVDCCLGGGGGGSRGAGGGVAVSQKAGRGGGVGVLLLVGRLGILTVGCAVVQVGAGADGGRDLGWQHQAGLHKGLWVNVRLGHPARGHRPEKMCKQSQRKEHFKDLAPTVYISQM